MSVYKRGDVWWFKFNWNGEQIRESSKQGNKRIAEQIEAARKTELAKGEVGIRNRKISPTLAEFAEQRFIPFVEKHKAEKLNTISFYKQCTARIRTFPRLWNARLDEIRAEDITAYIGVRQALSMSTSTVNRDLAALRRMFKLAMEWESVSKLLPTVRLLSGENRRERVITPDEETAYLEAAAPLLRDFTVLEFDCGLRPEEAHRLKWSQIRNGNIEIHTGKTRDARRSIPASPRVVAMLERRKSDSSASEWIFSAPTKAGHANTSTFKKQHGAALKTSAVDPFVIYCLRHTCLTRWAESGMDVFTLKKLAGHANISTTMRYVHMTDARSREALSKVWEVQGGHKNGHNVKSQASVDSAILL